MIYDPSKLKLVRLKGGGCNASKPVDNSETEHLRAEVARLQAEVARLEKENELKEMLLNPPSVRPGQPLQEKGELGTVELERVQTQAAKEERENKCAFEILDAAQLLDFPGKLMPRYQDLKHDHPDMLIPFTISLEEALNGTHVEDTLTTAHRWMHATVADVRAVQNELDGRCAQAAQLLEERRPSRVRDIAAIAAELHARQLLHTPQRRTKHSQALVADVRA